MKKLLFICAILSAVTVHAETWQSLETKLQERLQETFKDNIANMQNYYDQEFKRLTEPAFLKKNADQLAHELKIIYRSLWLSYLNLASIYKLYATQIQAGLKNGSVKTFKQFSDISEKIVPEFVELYDPQKIKEYRTLKLLLPMLQQTYSFLKNNERKAIECLHTFDSIPVDNAMYQELDTRLKNTLANDISAEKKQKLFELLHSVFFDSVFAALVPVLKDPEFGQMIEQYKNGQLPDFQMKPIYENLLNVYMNLGLQMSMILYSDWR